VAMVVADAEACWRRSRLAPPSHYRCAPAPAAGRALGVLLTADGTPQEVSPGALAATTALRPPLGVVYLHAKTAAADVVSRASARRFRSLSGVGAGIPE